MGDRTFLSLTCKMHDSPRIIDVFGGIDTSHTEKGVSELEISEVNYGGENELKTLVELGITFYGSHEGGDCYPPENFAHCEGKYLHVPQQDGYEMIIVSPNIETTTKNLVHLANYWQTFVNAWEDIHQGPCDKENYPYEPMYYLINYQPEQIVENLLKKILTKLKERELCDE